jgi:hypothetical protein
MHSSFRGPFRLGVLVVLTAATFVPAAQAHHAPGEDRAATASSEHLTWHASPLEVDRLGPKYVPLHHAVAPAPVSIVRIVRPRGFNWPDAAIGAAISALVLALAAVLTMLVTRRSRTPLSQERTDLAGA